LILLAVLLIGALATLGLMFSPTTGKLIQQGEDLITEEEVEPEVEVEEEEEIGTEVEPIAEKPTYLVTRVVDGDTIELETTQKVRYIGIDTPETVDPRQKVACFGVEASKRNKELVEGKIVRLEKDVSETDRYGRLLRYVFVQSPQGEIFINDLLVREGFAHSSPYPPDISKQAQLDKAEQEARTFNRGLWGSCP